MRRPTIHRSDFCEGRSVSPGPTSSTTLTRVRGAIKNVVASTLLGGDVKFAGGVEDHDAEPGANRRNFRMIGSSSVRLRFS